MLRVPKNSAAAGADELSGLSPFWSSQNYISQLEACRAWVGQRSISLSDSPYTQARLGWG